MHQRSFVKYAGLLMLLFFTFAVPLARAADTLADQQEDSLRQALSRLKGEERLKAWYQLYDMALASGDVAKQQQCCRDWIADARRQQDVGGESVARQNRIIDFFNGALYDSVYAEVPVAMDFCKKHKLLRKYFEAWHLLIATYHITGQYNTALREVGAMREVAKKENDSFGQSLAYFNMGNVYFSMGHYDESVEAYEKSIPLMETLKEKESVLLDIYPYYCDALEAKKDFDQLDRATRDWWKHIEDKQKKDGSRDQAAALANYYIARTQAMLGKGRLNEAKAMIDEAERLTNHEAFEWLYVLYYKAQHCMLTGQYAEAIRLNTERVRLCDEFDDKPTLIPVHRQRAQIFMAAGQYREAALAYKRTLDLSDSLNTASSRTQLNELNTLLKVDELEAQKRLQESQFTYQMNELEMQKRLQRSWFVVCIVTVVAVALLLLFIQYRRSAKRLKLKNDQLARSNEQLEEKNEALLVANARAEESSRMKTDFIQQISHEIRTPLNILSGFTQIITMPGMTLDDAEKKEMGSHITENVDRITGLVNKMLELAEASSQTVIEVCDIVSASQIAEVAVADSNIRQAKHLNFVLEAEEGIDRVALKTNQRYAIRALCLLLDNAQKFTRKAEAYQSMLKEDQKETVWLRVYFADKKMNFVVEDTGIGVPVEEAEHIFDKFVQLDEYYDGTGIGLTVARSIARRLGGDIVLDTAYTDGARFILTLPLEADS